MYRDVFTRRRKCCAAAVLVWSVATAIPACCAVAPQAYREAGVSLPADAAVPPDILVTDDTGRSRRLADLAGRPTVLVFADYTCQTLCGPIVAFVSAALERTGLRAGEQFGLVVVGLDPKDGAGDAVRMRRATLGAETALNDASVFVTADKAAVGRITSALGYRYVYDEEHDQYVHPGAAFVLRSDGHVVRVLSGLGISADDMRLALVEASDGRAGTWRDDVRLLCSGFDPAHGTYNLMVSRVLAGSVAASVVALGCGIGFLALLGRRRRTG